MSVSSKLAKTHAGVRIGFLDSGFLLEVDGENTNGEGDTFRAAVPDMASLTALISEVLAMPRT